MTTDLHRRPHYQFIVPKTYKMLGLLRQVFSLSLSLYLSFVHFKLLYCSPLWHPHLLTDIKSLETIIPVLLQPLKFNTTEPSPMFKVTFTSTAIPGYEILYPPLIQTCPLQLLFQNYDNLSGNISSKILIHIIHALFTIYINVLTAPSFLHFTF